MSTAKVDQFSLPMVGQFRLLIDIDVGYTVPQHDDVGYAGPQHDIDQDLPASKDMGGRLSSKVNTDTLTTGVRLKHRFETPLADVTPHVGARFTSLWTGRYRIRAAEGELFRVDSGTKNVWPFPLGVSLLQEIATDSVRWTLKPFVDASVVLNLGNRNAYAVLQVPYLGMNYTFRLQRTKPAMFLRQRWAGGFRAFSFGTALIGSGRANAKTEGIKTMVSACS